jgi:hypothetical protein
MALWLTQPLTEMSTRNLPGCTKRPADNLTAICELNVGASTSRNPKGLHGHYRDNFTFTFTYYFSCVSQNQCLASPALFTLYCNYSYVSLQPCSMSHGAPVWNRLRQSFHCIFSFSYFFIAPLEFLVLWHRDPLIAARAQQWKYCWKRCFLCCPLRGYITRPTEYSGVK